MPWETTPNCTNLVVLVGKISFPSDLSPVIYFLFYRQTQRAIGNNSAFKIPVRPVIELEALNVMPWDSLLFL